MIEDAGRRRFKSGGSERDVAKLLGRKIVRARAALFWEQLWPLFPLPATLVGGFLALGLFGLWRNMPPWAHVIALALAGIAVLLCLTPLIKVRWPSRKQGLDRLDAQSGFSHRPVEGFDDALAGPADAAHEVIWRVHRQRLIDRVRATPVRSPRPKSWTRDPFAFRAIVVLLMVVSFAYAGPDWWARVLGTVTPGAVAQIEPARLDAWISPPRYTARPPIFLADGARTIREIEIPVGPISVPNGSELVLRLHGGDDVELALTRSDGTAIPLTAPDNTADVKAKTGNGGGAVADDAKPGAFHHVLDASARLTLRNGDQLVEWQLDVVADTPPVIGFVEEMGETGDEALKVIYATSDDYGVVGVRAQFTIVPSDEPEQLGEDPGAPGNDGLELEIAAPDFDLILPGNRVRDVTRTAYKDLTAHPWAGIDVELKLRAVDEAGQAGFSENRRLIMPQRRFVDRMARAVVEQRRNLVRAPGRRDRVAKSLDALTIAPERYIEDSGVYLGLRTALYRTRNISTNEELAEVVDLLWDIALRIEDGDLSLAERDLRAAQDALERALAEGAPQDEIDRLLAELRQALERFMQAMREEALRNASRNPQQPLGPDQRMIQSQDIDKLMDMIEQLAKSGATDAAQQLLEQLRNMLENLESAIAQMSPQQGQMSETLDELGRMIGEQQRLMDETFRQDGQDGEDGQRGQQGQQGQQGRGQQGGSLAERQQALRGQLQRLMDQLAQGGLDVPGQLPRAGEEMGAAEDRLSEGQPGRALGPQGSAIDQLREGARSMAQQLVDGLAAQQGRNARGQSRPDGRTDPLGRPRQTTGPDFGLSVKIPDEIDAETARKLREELQRRIGDRTRRLLELDYLERLLRRF